MSRFIDLDIKISEKPSYDSGWFYAETGKVYTLSHNLKKEPKLIQVFVKSDGQNDGKSLTGDDIKIAGILSLFNGHFFGSVVENITNTDITLRTGDSALWHGAVSYDHFSTGFLRVLIWI